MVRLAFLMDEANSKRPQSPLYFAATKKHNDLFKFLATFDFKEALFQAAKANNVELVTWMLGSGKLTDDMKKGLQTESDEIKMLLNL